MNINTTDCKSYTWVPCYSAYCTNRTQVTLTVNLTSLVVIILNTMDITTVFLLMKYSSKMTTQESIESILMSVTCSQHKLNILRGDVYLQFQHVIDLQFVCSASLNLILSKLAQVVMLFDLNFTGTRFESWLGNQVQWAFLWFPSVPPGKCHDSTTNHTMTTFFSFLCSVSSPDPTWLFTEYNKVRDSITQQAINKYHACTDLLSEVTVLNIGITVICLNSLTFLLRVLY
jgi:hypothetical protein